MSSETTGSSGDPLPSWTEVNASDCATINEEFSIVEVDKQLEVKDLTILEAVSMDEDERGLTVAVVLESQSSNLSFKLGKHLQTSLIPKHNIKII